MKLTDEQIEVVAKQAAEAARLGGRHQNERTEMMEKQAAERAAAGLAAEQGQGPRTAPAKP